MFSPHRIFDPHIHNLFVPHSVSLRQFSQDLVIKQGQGKAMGNLQCTYPRVSAINTTQKDKGACLTNNVDIITPASNVLNHTPLITVLRKSQKKVMSPLPTPIKFKLLEEMLEGFDKDKLELLHSGFESGFMVFYSGNESGLESKNWRSTLLNPESVTDKLRKEISKGRIAGPFRKKLFGDKFKCSPLAIREKTTPGQYRLLHNLSYPYDKNSVNYNIPKEEATVQYECISDAVEIIRKLGRNCYMAKSDISEAFRLLPLNPDIYHLMGFTWEEMWYYDKCLPMRVAALVGCSQHSLML